MEDLMDKQSATHLIELLNIGNEAICHLEDCILRGELDLSDISLLCDMTELFNAISSVASSSTIPNRVKEINANLIYYLERLRTNVEESSEIFLYDFRFHFKTLFRILEFEIAYIIEIYVDKNNYPHLYPEVGNVDHNQIIEKGKNAKYKVSVILLAYNNLKVTRECVESILRNTQDLDYELILVNNGSTDGIKEYFNSIERAKVLHLEHNLHVVKGFNIGLMAAEGKYCAAVCNDFIFTPNWLKNIITCIESDHKIGFVSPGATYISNMQQIPIAFTSIQEFQEEARRYNKSNPRIWEERVVLLPNVLCCPTALLERIGYYDTRYYRGEFLDDDISFRIRRAGYKLVFCADTVTHHYGSLTTGSDHLTNSMQEGRDTFRARYGLDAWEDARMDSVCLNIDYQKLQDTKTVLGIDVKCGANLLQIKNKIWEYHGVKPILFTCTTDEKYVTDLKTISEEVFLVNSLNTFEEKSFGKVDLVFIEKAVDCYNEDLGDIFKKVSQIIRENGQLILVVNNNISIETIFAQINSSPTIHNRKIYMHPSVYSLAEEYGFKLSRITNIVNERSNEANLIAEYIAKAIAGGREEDKKYVETLLKTSSQLYQFSYQKN